MGCFQIYRKCPLRVLLFQIKAYPAAEKSCSQVLQVDPDNVKALFRKGKVLAASGDTDQAIGLIKKADQLDPSNQVS